MGLELADLFREYGADYRKKYADKLLPSHRRAMWAIEHCRTVQSTPESGERSGYDGYKRKKRSKIHLAVDT
jgi:hypothetical protein